MTMLEVFRERREQVNSALGELCEVARSIGAVGLADRLERDVRQKLREDRFHLVVVGEFNHGKTTFVNALLGERVLPTGVTPTTAVIHHVTHGPEARAHRVSVDTVGIASGAGEGVREELTMDELREFTAEGGRAGESGGYLEVQYPSEFLAERIVLVDTPGVNDLSHTRAEITYDYIPRSDAVLFLLDAGQPVKESEREFLEKQLIGRSRDKIVFVVTKTDIWSDEERGEALDYIRGALSDVIDDPLVFPVSAQSALDGERSGSGIDELLAHLTRFLAEERGRIILGNALEEGMSAAALVVRGVGARRRAATLTVEQLDQRIALLERDLAGQAETVEQRRMMIREEVGGIKARARKDLDRFVEDTMGQLPAMIEAASSDDLKQHLGAFLQHAVEEWAGRESAEIARALEALAERTVALLNEDAHEAATRLGDTLSGDLTPPKVSVDTFAYDFGILAVMGVGISVLFANALLGGVLLAAGPALAVWHRGRTERELRKKALELARPALHEAAAKIGPKLEQMIEDFAVKLETWVVATGEELHREVIEVLRQARSEHTEHSASSEELHASCDREQARLDEVTARLVELRESYGAVAEPAPESGPREVLPEAEAAPGAGEDDPKIIH